MGRPLHKSLSEAGGVQGSFCTISTSPECTLCDHNSYYVKRFQVFGKQGVSCWRSLRAGLLWLFQSHSIQRRDFALQRSKSPFCLERWMRRISHRSGSSITPLWLRSAKGAVRRYAWSCGPRFDLEPMWARLADQHCWAWRFRSGCRRWRLPFRHLQSR